MNPNPSPAAIAPVLTALGCPADRVDEMARQLHRRAQQLAALKGRSYEEALAHLLRLVQQGQIPQPPSPIPHPQSPIPSPQSEIPPPSSAIPSPTIRPWPTLESKQLAEFRIFTVRNDRKTSPRTGQPHDFFVIDCRNWVNIVALTPNDEVVMVEQFRHGTNTVELEIPGGLLDARDPSPEHCGARELREETGYEGAPPILIGSVHPNPAIMSNTCFTVLTRDCTLRHPVEFDHGEDILTRLVPYAEIPQLIVSGAIRHSLVVAALTHYSLHRSHPLPLSR